MRIHYLIPFFLALLVGCESPTRQTAQTTWTFKYNGLDYAYAKKIFDVYSHAWHPSARTTTQVFVTRATVEIGRNGEVLAARIFKPSGDEATDKSVQKALDTVRFIAPFESGTKDRARTFIINFDSKAHRIDLGRTPNTALEPTPTAP